MILINKALIVSLTLFFGEGWKEAPIEKRVAVAPTIYEDAYEYADIVYTERRTVTVLWRRDVFGTLQPFIAHIQYRMDEPQPVICRNSDEYAEVIILYESQSLCKVKGVHYCIDVFRYCPITREIREIVLLDKCLNIPEISGKLRNAISQRFPENIDNIELNEELLKIYSENVEFEP